MVQNNSGRAGRLRRCPPRPPEPGNGDSVVATTDLARDHRVCGFDLPDIFWSRFVAENWETAPRVFHRPTGRPVLGPAELFDGLVAACEAYRSSRRVSDRTSRVRFSVDHSAVITDVAPLLPARDDGSVDGYFARLDRQLQGRTFELIVNEFQEHSLPLWEALAAFLAGLYRRVGLPGKRAEVAVFLRRQATTSFGVHRDDASVFLFPVIGRKRILAWHPGAFGSRNPTSTLDYEAHRPDALELEGGPGDVLYWPSSHWHVGESDDGPSVSVNLGLHLGSDPAADLQTALALLLGDSSARRQGPSPNTIPNDLRPGSDPLPPAMAELADTLRAATEDGGLERALRLMWADRMTGLGFARCPAAEPLRPVLDGDVVQGVARVVWVPWAGGKVACSASGHSFSATDSPALHRLLERLNAGVPHLVRRLVAECAGDDAEEGQFLTSVLARLVAARAVLVRPGKEDALR